MPSTVTSTTGGWRHIVRYAYIERPYDDVWGWLAGHLSTLGQPLPGGGRSVELHIRPAGVEISRPVHFHVSGLVCGNERATAAIGWVDAARPRLFPEFSAVLEVAPVRSDGAPFTQLGIIARYRPPFGPVGALGDRLIGADLTDEALNTLLDELARAAEGDIDPPAPAESPDQPDAEHHKLDDPGLRRLVLQVDGLAVRPGGAVGVAEALADVPGVVNVSLNPPAGLVSLDHDPAVSRLHEMLAVLDAPDSG
jgi:hypothetical protein